ncbi:MAG: beta-lactamase family protein, partial [Kiritimatiellae bacterium]|nr:beta-lactamase family protein [Kiritimatiellia bacterium]
MDKIGTRRVGMAAIAFLTGFCFAETKDSGTHFAEEAVLPYIQKGECPGAISIFYKDGVQETACMGWADVDKKIPMTLDKMFMQCSQTKGFCGVTIAMLVEEGKLSLDDPVHKYLPEFKTLWIQTSDQDGVRTLVKAKNVLTVKDVMNHTGGFPFEIPSKSVLGWPGVPLRVTAAEAAACPIFFEPGTKERYSNTGIDIGAAIVEVITGKKWDVFLKERVLDPLGMTDSTFNPTNEQLARSI